MLILSLFFFHPPSMRLSSFVSARDGRGEGGAARGMVKLKGPRRGKRPLQLVIFFFTHVYDGGGGGGDYTRGSSRPTEKGRCHVILLYAPVPVRRTSLIRPREREVERDRKRNA